MIEVHSKSLIVSECSIYLVSKTYAFKFLIKFIFLFTASPFLNACEIKMCKDKKRFLNYLMDFINNIQMYYNVWHSHLTKHFYCN